MGEVIDIKNRERDTLSEILRDVLDKRPEIMMIVAQSGD